MAVKARTNGSFIFWGSYRWSYRAVVGLEIRFSKGLFLLSDHRTASIRSRAIKLHRATSSLTVMVFSIVPRTIFSKLQHKCAKSIRYIVAHIQTSGERKCISCSGCCCLSLLTKCSSVPMAHLVPAGAFFTVSMILLVEPDISAMSVSYTHLRAHET